MQIQYAYHKLIMNSNMQIFFLREARLFRFIKNQRQDTIWNTIILMGTSIKPRSPCKGWVTWFACLLAKLTIGFGITTILVRHSRSTMWYSEVICWFSCKLSTNGFQSIQKITFEMFNSWSYFIAWSKAHAFASSLCSHHWKVLHLYWSSGTFLWFCLSRVCINCLSCSWWLRGLLSMTSFME